MKAAELHETRIDPAHVALVRQWHGADQVLFEPCDRLAGGQHIDTGRIDPAIDRAGHQRQAARLGRVVVLGHQRGGRERGHAGLAYGHHMGAGADGADAAHHVIDVVVESEPAFAQVDVARVVPVRDVDVVVLQQGARGFAQQRREVAGQRRHQQDRRLPGERVVFLAEMQQAAERQSHHGVFRDRDRLLAPVHAVDAEGRPGMRQSHAREHFHGRRRPAQQRTFGVAEPERDGDALREQAKG